VTDHRFRIIPIILLSRCL